jgi:hypothetical protein
VQAAQNHVTWAVLCAHWLRDCALLFQLVQCAHLPHVCMCALLQLWLLRFCSSSFTLVLDFLPAGWVLITLLQCPACLELASRNSQLEVLATRFLVVSVFLTVLVCLVLLFLWLSSWQMDCCTCCF